MSDVVPSGGPSGGKLASERVIINAPMSFAGAAQRTWRFLGWLQAKTGGNVWLRRLLWMPLVILIPLLEWWALILAWYCIFGLWLVPYRLLRRGSRKRKAEALRHRELLDALDKRR
jgi:hypothetical protein